MDSKQYWDNKIIEWEDSMQGGKKVSWIERLATHFRKPLLYRAALTVDMLSPIVKGKRVLELGCGSGFTAFHLVERGQPASYVGIDISPTAVSRANALATQKNLTGTMSFVARDVIVEALPEADVVIGLGFLDYLTGEEITQLFDRIPPSSTIFFSFAERKMSLLRTIHQVYLLTQQCPKHFYYTKDEMRRYTQKNFPSAVFLSDPRLSFASIIHNLK